MCSGAPDRLGDRAPARALGKGLPLAREASPLDVLARIARAIEALDDGELNLARDILSDLELELAQGDAA